MLPFVFACKLSGTNAASLIELSYNLPSDLVSATGLSIYLLLEVLFVETSG